MDEHSEMPVFHLSRQNDDARICGYAEHRTISGAIIPLFLAFEYIHTAQIMCAHSTITKNDLHHYEKRPGPLCSSAFKLQKIRAHARISELRGSSARIAFVSIDEMVRICIISLKCALHSSQRVSPGRDLGRDFTGNPFVFDHVVDF